MTYSFHTDEFELAYTESQNDQSVLWENHCHAKFEMIAVLEGDVNVLLEGRRYRLKENQTIILPPLCYHSISVNEGAIYRRVTALFDLAAIPSVLHPKFIKEEADVSISFFSRIEELKKICQKGDTAFYAPLAKSLMVELLYESIKSTADPSYVNTDKFLQTTVLYIEQNLHKKILLDDLARLTSRSKSSFCHLFQEKMKISPGQYIVQKKL